MVLEERSAANICGYPICSKPKSGMKGRYKIANGKLLSMEQLFNFCSRECLACYQYLISQMSVEPVYLRKLPDIELLKFESQSFDHPIDAEQLDRSISDLTIKENTFSITELSNALEKSTVDDSIKLHKDIMSNQKFNLNIEKIKPSISHKKKESYIEPEDDDDDSIQSCVNSDCSLEDEEWLVPSKKKVFVKLSVFAKIWTYLDRLITNNSKLLVKGLDIEESVTSVNSQNVTRLNMFSKSIITTYNSLKRTFNIKLLLEDDLLKLMKSFDYKEFSAGLSKIENWIFTSIFLRVLALNSEKISREFDGKWDKIIEKTGLSGEQFNVLCRAF